MRRARLAGTIRGRKPRILLSGAAASLIGYVTLALLAAQQQFVVIDEGTRAWVGLLRAELPPLPWLAASLLGDYLGLIPLILIGSILLWRVSRRWALALPVLMAGAGALQYVTKWASNRPRPDATPWGFPSGHVLSLVVFFGLMVYLIWTVSGRRRRWRALACLVCVATVVAVAFSRLYLDRHWLSDLAGGLAAGTAYLLVMIWVVEIVPRRTREAPLPARAPTQKPLPLELT
jgi:undecaprenyl-diphosphatase